MLELYSSACSNMASVGQISATYGKQPGFKTNKTKWRQENDIGLRYRKTSVLEIKENFEKPQQLSTLEYICANLKLFHALSKSQLRRLKWQLCEIYNIKSLNNNEYRAIDTHDKLANTISPLNQIPETLSLQVFPKLPKQSYSAEAPEGWCVAKFNFTPRNNDELKLSQGDDIFILEKCDDGWFIGYSISSGNVGAFPSNYIT